MPALSALTLTAGLSLELSVSPGSRGQLDSVGKTRMADNQEDSAASPGLGWRILKVFEGINEVPRKV